MVYFVGQLLLVENFVTISYVMEITRTSSSFANNSPLCSVVGVSFMPILVHHSFIENHVFASTHLVFAIPNATPKHILVIANEGAFLRFGIKLILALITNMNIC